MKVLKDFSPYMFLVKSGKREEMFAALFLYMGTYHFKLLQLFVNVSSLLNYVEERFGTAEPTGDDVGRS